MTRPAASPPSHCPGAPPKTQEKDGVVTEGDFVHLGQEVVRLRGTEHRASSRAALRQTRSSWPTGGGGTPNIKGGDADGDGQMILEEYLAFVGAWVGSEPEALTHAIQDNQVRS